MPSISSNTTIFLMPAIVLLADRLRLPTGPRLGQIGGSQKGERFMMPRIRKPVDIGPARGRLGVLMPGMGAVATTFIAGVEAVLRGLAKPIGSLTQMGTIRLGKRTEGRSPLIREFVPLAKLDDIVFGGWDLFPDDAFQAASKAGVLSKDHLTPLKDFLSSVKPMTP